MIDIRKQVIFEKLFKEKLLYVSLKQGQSYHIAIPNQSIETYPKWKMLCRHRHKIRMLVTVAIRDPDYRLCGNCLKIYYRMRSKDNE